MQIAAPAVPPVVGVQAVAHGAVGGALHGDVERRVDAQAALVHRLGAVGALEIFADFLDEIWRQVLRGACTCSPSGCAMACARLRVA